jgi:hypothetical protein
MSKKLNESGMQSELAGSAFFTPPAPATGSIAPSPAPQSDATLESVATEADEQFPVPTTVSAPPPSQASEAASPDRLPSQSTPHQPDQPDGQPVSRLASRLRDQPASRIVVRPKSFYVTERLHEWLDTAVRYYQEIHGIPKADRSAIVNALLDREELWTDEALDQLASEVIDRLTSRLTS